ncbi:MAG: glycosyltransferase family 39 protein [Bacteroidota bacterium]|nr:glycosyltransferase family 39 protein [Bacteroidota bacterium]
MDKIQLRNNVLIALFGALLFIPFLGSVHLFDWDEINFAECAREMIVTGNYSKVQINFQPFWEKPPLFIWMQVLSMKMFGVNEFAARFPNAVCGIVTLLVLYNIGRKLFSDKFGLLWVLVYAGSFLTFFYFKTGIIDPWFNLFIFLGIYYAILHTNNPVGKNGISTALLSGAFIGLSVLTKGPVGLLIFGLTVGVFALMKRFKGLTKVKFLVLFVISFLIFGFGWFLIEVINGNADLVKEFIVYQVRLFNTKDAGHGGFLLYHFVVLLIGCFPASLFFLQSHQRSESDTPYQKHFKKWMIILFWVVLILFTIVKTKIVHYSSMCWFPLTFLSAYSIHKLLAGEYSFKKWTLYIGITLAMLLGIVFTAIPFIDSIKPYVINSGIIGDKFAIKNLEANGGWGGYEWIPGFVFLVGAVLLLMGMLRRQKARFIPLVFGVSLFAVFFISVLVVPKVELYTQGAAIEFYKSLKGKDCYLETSGFKSYAYLFYAEKRPEQNTTEINAYVAMAAKKEENDERWDPAISYSRYSTNFMIDEKVSKETYIVIKFMNEEELTKARPKFKKLYAKNGFVFLRREAEL